ncbi:MAG: hypothetical protein ACRCTA_07290 [Bacilli bacterium]
MNNKMIYGLSIFTAVGIAAYWILVFTGIFEIVELVDGFTTWFYSFPLADLWIMFSATMLAISIKKNKTSSIVWSLLTASSLIFLALNGFLFGLNTGLLFSMTIDEIIEIVIKVYCITIGSYFICFAWKQLDQLSYRSNS